MKKALHVLLVEDSEDDTMLILRQLRRAGYVPEFRRVSTPVELATALEAQAWDLVISDFRLPGFDGLAALKQVRGCGQDLPFILVSGVIGEEQAVEAMKAGAHDFLLKSNLSRLGPAVGRELREAEGRQRRRAAEAALRESEAATHRANEELAVVNQRLQAASEALRVANEELRVGNETLEARVAARTAELRQSNETLRREIRIREQIEQQLTEAELRYWTVAEFTYDWEYWETPDYLLRYCSPSCERITGYSAQEFMADPRLLQRIVHPDDAGLWHKHRAAALTEPQPRVAEFRIRRKDGSVRWMEHACQAVLGKNAVFLGIRASNRDVTDRKEEEMQAQQVREELAQVSRATTAGQLAASLAHELNQPLAAIHCNAETAAQLLAAHPPDLGEAREAVADIAGDSERAGGMIYRLRALFSKTGPERTVLQVNEIIQETLELLRGEFVLKGISIEAHLEPALPTVLGQRIELQQVFINLVANGIEAMSACPAGERPLLVTTGCEGPRDIRISIRDSGHGIRVEPISRLFEPFFTTKTSGMGMGLAICRTIMEAHDGTLQAANNPDRGATFQLTLPVHRGEPS